MRNPESGNRFVQLHTLLPTLPGFKLRSQIEELSVAWFVFDKNYAELHSLCYWMTRSEEAERLLAARQDEFLKLLLEVIRRLNNYVASAMSLVDHTRNLYGRLGSNSNAFKDYEKRKDDDFAANPMARFVQKLRNYVLHYGTTPVRFNQSLERKTLDEPMVYEKAIVIAVKDLLLWDGWGSQAKGYLADKTTINLTAVCADYYALVKSFQEWFRNRLTELHAAELKELGVVEKEYRELLIQSRIQLERASRHFDTYGEASLLFQILSSSQLDVLYASTPDRSSRAELAIRLLDAPYPLPDGLKAEIRAIYEDPAFRLTVAPKLDASLDEHDDATVKYPQAAQNPQPPLQSS